MANARGLSSLRVDRNQRDREVLNDLRLALLSDGIARASGRDCRSLQLLVKVVAQAGLEIRDAEGSIVVATGRLVKAWGHEPDRKRLRLRWHVEVTRPTVAVPDGSTYRIDHMGPDGKGRRLVFSRGAVMVLWEGDCS